MNSNKLTAYVLSMAALSLSTLLAAQEPPRAITNVTGDLYTVQNDAHNTVFLVTPEGIILTDPISTDFSV